MQTTHMATPVLEVAHLEKVYGALGNVTRALNDVSFTVNRGEFVGIMGASGSGKSTLLNCVSTIDSATSGTIRINGQDVTRMKQAKLSQFRREELGFIFQDSNLLDTLTAHADGCVGMAANMIGVLKRIIAVEAEDGGYLVLFNPVILKKSGLYEAEEGCLSLEGVRKTKRYQSIKVQYQTMDGKPRIKTFAGWTAQIIQHEIDHCDGILI